MKVGKIDASRYLLRLELGEEIISALQAFCKNNNIGNASISGIGSVENPTLAHYFVTTKKYSEQEMKGIFEVTSLLGTVAIVDREPLVHLHTTLSDESMHAFGGHLVKGNVSATLELIVTIFSSKFEKKYSEEIGLKLYELPDEV